MYQQIFPFLNKYLFSIVQSIPIIFLNILYPFALYKGCILSTLSVWTLGKNLCIYQGQYLV